MRVVWNYIRWIHRSRSAIRRNKLVVLSFWDNDEVACSNEYAVACLNEGVVKFLDENNKDDFDADFILPYPLR